MKIVAHKDWEEDFKLSKPNRKKVKSKKVKIKKNRDERLEKHF